MAFDTPFYSLKKLNIYEGNGTSACVQPPCGAGGGFTGSGVGVGVGFGFG